MPIIIVLFNIFQTGYVKVGFDCLLFYHHCTPSEEYRGCYAMCRRNPQKTQRHDRRAMIAIPPHRCPRFLLGPDDSGGNGDGDGDGDGGGDVGVGEHR